MTAHQPQSALTEDQFDPVEEISGAIDSGLLLLCDHASNALPARYGSLGLPRSELERHIGYDIGVAPITRALSERLNAPALLTRFSRLLIDPNRGADDPTLVMRLSEGTVIPGNATINDAEIAYRRAAFYDPYNRAIDRKLTEMAATGVPPAVFSIHSFTPVYKGVERPWDVGILWDRDDRLAGPVLEALRADPALVVGDNEPYTGALDGDTLNRHATARGFANALIEIRQDLITGDDGITVWAERLVAILTDILPVRG
ncbi:MAG: N-formylglutamate amidohydrolase [Pseudomonadota bacterium]